MAGEASDPYLMTGFENKCLQMSHTPPIPVRMRIELDFNGCGNCQMDEELDIHRYRIHTFPVGLSAHWARVVSEENCTASAQFFYT